MLLQVTNKRCHIKSSASVAALDESCQQLWKQFWVQVEKLTVGVFRPALCTQVLAISANLFIIFHCIMESMERSLWICCRHYQTVNWSWLTSRVARYACVVASQTLWLSAQHYAHKCWQFLQIQLWFHGIMGSVESLI
jgi:hypothetical protein